jgi:hypothetical protein
MGRGNKNKKKKRKKSSETDQISQINRQFKHGGSPQENNVTVSEILGATDSVLFPYDISQSVFEFPSISKNNREHTHSHNTAKISKPPQETPQDLR